MADDEEELLELIRFSLDAEGFQVTTAKNGKQALDLVRSQNFDLVILDVMMPQMDGYHVSGEIAGDPDAPPVLLLTSRDYDQDQAAVRGCGASAFLSKPFDMPDLFEAVRNLIDRGK